MVKVAVVMPADFADAAEFLAEVRALEAAGADTIELAGGDVAVLGAIAAVTHRVRLRVSANASAAVLQKLSRGRVVDGALEGESWARVRIPADRGSWATMLREQEVAGGDGVIVDWDPRLLDLLRNPEPDDRSDLLISTG